MITRIIIFVVFLAIVAQIAPGEPEWKHAAVDDDDDVSSDALLRFVGGDGFTLLRGNLHMPYSELKLIDKPPVIVLAHGLGLSQDCSLEPFVKAFTQAGFAALTFD